MLRLTFFSTILTHINNNCFLAYGRKIKIFGSHHIRISVWSFIQRTIGKTRLQCLSKKQIVIKVDKNIFKIDLEKDRKV